MKGEREDRNRDRRLEEGRLNRIRKDTNGG